jgi:protein-tyrosine phosphatase
MDEARSRPGPPGRHADDGSGMALRWDGCLNVRDLGGLPLKGGGSTAVGVVIRSDSLEKLSEVGWTTFWTHKVASVLDLRSGTEVAKYPHPLREWPGYRHTPLWNEAVDAEIDAGATTPEVYRALLDLARSEVHAVFSALAAGVDHGLVVLHCFSGKDRTGVAVALLLDLAGVERGAIGADFAASEPNLRAIFDEWLAAEADEAARLRLAEALSCRPSDVTGMLDYADEVHGGTESYLVECGVTRSELAVLRSCMRGDRLGSVTSR